MNARVHVYEENFAGEKCFEKSTSILCPVMDGFICLIISFNYEGIFQTKSSKDSPKCQVVLYTKIVSSNEVVKD